MCRHDSAIGLSPLATRASDASRQYFAKMRLTVLRLNRPFCETKSKIGTRVAWPLIQPGPQGGNFVHARTSSHSKERLSSFQRSLESLNCDFHVAPIDVAEPERNQFACPKSVLKANDQQGVISSAPSSSSFEDIEQFIFAQMLERV